MENLNLWNKSKSERAFDAVNHRSQKPLKGHSQNLSYSHFLRTLKRERCYEPYASLIRTFGRRGWLTPSISHPQERYSWGDKRYHSTPTSYEPWKGRSGREENLIEANTSWMANAIGSKCRGRPNDLLSDSIIRIKNAYSRGFEQVSLFNSKETQELLDAFLHGGYIQNYSCPYFVRSEV